MGSKIFNEATSIELIDGGFAAGEKPEKPAATEEYPEEDEDYDAISEEHRLNEMASSSETTTTETKSNANTVDYDKWIDEYEEYFNTLSKYYKKIKNGDQSAYADYAKSLQKFNSLTEKLQGAENEMTPAQTMRMSRIVQKFSLEMQQ